MTPRRPYDSPNLFPSCSGSCPGHMLSGPAQLHGTRGWVGHRTQAGGAGFGAPPSRTVPPPMSEASEPLLAVPADQRGAGLYATRAAVACLFCFIVRSAWVPPARVLTHDKIAFDALLRDW